jgi:hypothetical protein
LRFASAAAIAAPLVRAGGQGLVQLALRHGLLFGEGLQALVFRFRELALHAFLLERRARLLHGQFIRRGVDLEERLSRRHGGAFLEEALLEDAVHARADLHLARAFRLPHRLDRDRHLLLRHLHDRDRHRRRRRALCLRLGARLLLRAARGRDGYENGWRAKRAVDSSWCLRNGGIGYYTYVPERM